jgi:molybdate transport system substrate-binding protein
MRTWLKFAAGTVAAILGVAGLGTAQAADLIVFSSMGSVSGLNELAPAFTRMTGHKLIVIQEGGAALEQKLNSNAPADLMVLNTGAMQDLIKRGKVVAGSSVVFARAAVGLSVKSGAPRPDISTPEAFKRTMLSAKSVGYSRGGSGNVAARAIEKLGIAAEMKPKTTFTDVGPAAGYVARGEVEMAIQQYNVSKPVAGTDYIGDLPGDLHDYVVFAIAVMTVSKEQEAAKALIKFAITPEAGPLLRAGMMEPKPR